MGKKRAARRKKRCVKEEEGTEGIVGEKLEAEEDVETNREGRERRSKPWSELSRSEKRERSCRSSAGAATGEASSEEDFYVKAAIIEEEFAKRVREAVVLEVSGMRGKGRDGEQDVDSMEIACRAGLGPWTRECREVLEWIQEVFLSYDYELFIDRFLVLRWETESLRREFLIRCLAIQDALAGIDNEGSSVEGCGLGELS